MKRMIAAALLALPLLACTPEDIIRAEFASEGPAVVATAVRVSACESAGKPDAPIRPEAKNPRSSATGPWQLLKGHWAGKFDPHDTFVATQYAHQLYRSSGWSPWKSSHSCWS